MATQPEIATLTRRQALTLAGGALIAAASASGAMTSRPAAAVEPILTDDGLYKQDWFLESFLDLAEDLTMAAAAGKRFAVMWELKGCPYCKETHFTNFADPAINDFIRNRFDVLQLNIIGSRLVTDFDGAAMSEKALAGKYGVRFTPTIQFFAPSADGLDAREPRQREVARMPGYFKPRHFLAMFRFVHDRAYEREDFRSFLKQQAS